MNKLVNGFWLSISMLLSAKLWASDYRVMFAQDGNEVLSINNISPQDNPQAFFSKMNEMLNGLKDESNNIYKDIDGPFGLTKSVQRGKVGSSSGMLTYDRFEASCMAGCRDLLFNKLSIDVAKKVVSILGDTTIINRLLDPSKTPPNVEERFNQLKEVSKKVARKASQPLPVGRRGSVQGVGDVNVGASSPRGRSSLGASDRKVDAYDFDVIIKKAKRQRSIAQRKNSFSRLY